MAKNKTVKLYKRRWLNSTEGSAYAIVSAESNEVTYGKLKGGTELYATLEIKDCNRQAMLEFWCDNQNEYKARLKKIEALRQSLNELEAFMLANPPTKPYADKKAPRKPVELASELLLTERHPDPPSLRGELTAPLREPSIVEIGPVVLTPVTISRMVRERRYKK